MDAWKQQQKRIKEERQLEEKILLKLKLGGNVYYHSIINDPHDNVVRKIESEPWQLGHGAWVVKVTGVVGGVSIRALTFKD